MTIPDSLGTSLGVICKIGPLLLPHVVSVPLVAAVDEAGGVQRLHHAVVDDVHQGEAEDEGGAGLAPQLGAGHQHAEGDGVGQEAEHRHHDAHVARILQRPRGDHGTRIAAIAGFFDFDKNEFKWVRNIK